MADAQTGKQMAEQVLTAIKALVAGRLAPVAQRLADVERRLDGLPLPQRGERGEKGDVGANGERGAQGPIGGVGPEGKVGERGENGGRGEQGIPGRDGAPGRDGLSGLSGEKGRDGTDGLHGKDGSNGLDGKDGRDGFGFEDMTEELADDGRTVIRRYARGELTKEFRHTFAVVLDRGVYRSGETYYPGDAVTFGGSVWIAQAATGEKPGVGRDWRLSVKHGRDGKDGKDGARGPVGPEGKPGR